MANHEYVLTAEKRSEHGKGPAHRLRVEGRVPAILYGHGKSAVAFSTPRIELAGMIHHTGLVTLKMEGRKRDITAIIKEIQLHPVSGNILHADFQEVRADEVIAATIPIEPHGTPRGASMGGVLEQILHEVEIKCEASKLPEVIRVEVAGMELDDIITVKDLALPDGAVADADPEQIVFTVALPAIEEAAAGEEAEEALEGEEGAAEPEVIGKGKKEEEETEE